MTGLEIVAVADLRSAAAVLKGADPPALPDSPTGSRPAVRLPDLADVRGHAAPLLALEIAAAGGHNLLMEGAPGTGKTMLARRLPSILPELTRAEAIEVTRIHSVAGVARRTADRRAPVPRAAPHDFAVRAGGRGLAAAAGRSDACPSRSPVSGRAV